MRRKITLYLFSLLWLAFAYLIIPELLVRWFANDLPDWLDLKRATQPLSSYERKWSDWRATVNLAIACAAVLILLCNKAGGLTSRMRYLFNTVVVVSMAVAVLSGRMQDYWNFLNFWEWTINGEPWRTVDRNPNAYGPLFNILAIFTFACELGPKLIFTSVWLLAALALITKARPNARINEPIWLMLFLPYFWIQIPLFATFDILPAAAALLALHLRMKQLYVVAGFCLGCAVLLKYYPLALLPFLSLDGRRIRWRVVFGCLACMVVGFGLSLSLWGQSTFNPLLFATDRESKLLSVFAYLRSPHSPTRWFGMQSNLDSLSVPLMGISWMALWFYCLIKRVPTIPACLLGMLVALTWYKVGHSNFHMTPILLVAYWIASSVGGCPRGGRAALAIAVYISWITLFDILYFFSDGYAGSWVIVRRTVGGPSFLIFVWVILEIALIYRYPDSLRDEIDEPNASQAKPADFNR